MLIYDEPLLSGQPPLSGPSAYSERGRLIEVQLYMICISGHQWRVLSDVIGQVWLFSVLDFVTEIKSGPLNSNVILKWPSIVQTMNVE